MFLNLIIILLIVFIILWNLYKYLTVWKYLEKLPGPKTIPVIGNAHQIGTNPTEYLNNLMKWWKQYNCNTYRIWIGSQPYVIVTDPKDVETILTNTKLLQKGEVYDLLRPWLGDGLLTSYGSKWQKHRKMITPSFHFKILIDFLDIMNENSRKFVEKLNDKANGDVFDIQKMIHYCTLDIICETAMGTRLNSMDNPKSSVVTAFQDMCYTIQNSAFNPIKRNIFTFKFTEDYRTQQKALNILKDFTLNVIEQRRKILKKSNEFDETITSPNNTEEQENDEFINNDKGTTKISTTVASSMDGIRQKKAFLDNLLTATIDGRPLTSEEIFEEVSTFMFEGHDTTTSGIAFSVYILSRHQDIQDNVYKEQKQIFGNNILNCDPTYQEIQDMKYLDLLIKESQRLYPSVPFIARFCHEDFNLNGTIIPKNSTITLFIIAMGYNEKYFKDPFNVDVHRFDPNIREKLNPFEYVPFSAGPRNCIGQKFAVLELKSILSRIVRNFEILPPSEDCIYNNNNKKINNINKEINSNLYNNGKDTPMGSNNFAFNKNYINNNYEPQLASVLTLKSENGIQIRLRKRK